MQNPDFNKSIEGGYKEKAEHEIEPIPDPTIKNVSLGNERLDDRSHK